MFVRGAFVSTLGLWLGCSSTGEVDPGNLEPGQGQGGALGQGGVGSAGAPAGPQGSVGHGGSMDQRPRICEPGATEPCYSGPPGTDGVGSCHAGVRTCSADGAAWSECQGEVTPVLEDCATTADDDCNGDNGTSATPTVALASGAVAIPGPTVHLEWSGGTAPYEVEVAFDPEFADPVPGMSPRITSDPGLILEGLRGGYFYWRVRGLGGCGASEFATAQELHVTCSAVNLTAGVDLGLMPTAIAWNAVDKEYGIILSAAAPVSFYFVRTDRLGNIVFGPTEITGASLPPNPVGYQHPDLAYIPGTDRWATVYHREGADQAYITLFDDTASVIATRELDDGFDSEVQTIAYHPGASRIVTSNDHGGSVWNTYVHQFDGGLSPATTPINVSRGAVFPYNGAFGPLIALPGLSSGRPEVLVLFDHRTAINPDVHRIMMQRLDLITGALGWPFGASLPNIAGKPILGATVHVPWTSAAWSPEQQAVGVAYTDNQDGMWSATKNVFFLLVDPQTGAELSPPARLNPASSSSVRAGAPKVEWDGEEFLVVWNDTRTSGLHTEIRMTTLGGGGLRLGSGDRPYVHPGWMNIVNGGWTHALCGHDRVHAMVYGHRDVEADITDAYLCVEPLHD